MLEKIYALRQELHNIPELSLKEYKTKECLINFLKNNTNLKIIDKDNWFYCIYEAGTKKIAFRADYDAVMVDNAVGHYCGHDGHSATLCALALLLDEIKPKNTIYLIFQPAEEIGAGAKICMNFLQDMQIDEIYGYHNIPGYEKNKILVTNDVFAYASTGMKITLIGKPSHASNPEYGINPSTGISKIITYINEFKKTNSFITITGISSELSYGVSMSKCHIHIVLRSSDNILFNDALNELNKAIENISKEESLKYEIEYVERFDATNCNAELTNKIISICKNKNIDFELISPFKWSEDFGVYTEKIKGTFFGVGLGNKPYLHTKEYVFDDEIIETVLEIYKDLL